jgi:hypothetical protein
MGDAAYKGDATAVIPIRAPRHRPNAATIITSSVTGDVTVGRPDSYTAAGGGASLRTR